MEQFKKKKIVRLEQCVIEQYRYRDVYAQQLTYVTETKVHRTTNLMKFSMFYSLHPSGLTDYMRCLTALLIDPTAATSPYSL